MYNKHTSVLIKELIVILVDVLKKTNNKDGSFICPFCEVTFALVQGSTYNTFRFDSKDIFTDKTFPVSNYTSGIMAFANKNPDYIAIHSFICPKCDKTSIYALGYGNDFEGLFVPIHPKYAGRKLPEYLPQAIREDYEEAMAIVHLSPKAAATLARRCMQAIIRDFWQIPKQKDLFNEIEYIKDKIDPEVYNGLHSLRDIGNIGAHMQKDVNLIIDVDQNEATLLLQFIDLLVKETYVNRQQRDFLLNEIKKTGEEKKALKNKNQ